MIEEIFFKLYPNEYKQYEASVNVYRDVLNIKRTAFEKGKIKGKIEIAKEMLKDDEPIEKIMRYTGLTKEQINDLK